MVALDFDLRAFLGSSSHQSHNSLASRIQVEEGKPFHFRDRYKKNVGRANLGFPRHPHGQGPTPLQTTRPPSLLDATGQSLWNSVKRTTGIPALDSGTGESVLIDGIDRSASSSRQRISISSAKAKEDQLILPVPPNFLNLLLGPFASKIRAIRETFCCRSIQPGRIRTSVNGIDEAFQRVLTSPDSLLFQKSPIRFRSSQTSRGRF